MTRLMVSEIPAGDKVLLKRDSFPNERLSSQNRFDLAIAALIVCGNRKLRALPHIEHISPDRFMALRIEQNSVLEPVLVTLRANGLVVERTLGGVASALGVSQDQMHIFCNCIEGMGSDADGYEASRRMHTLKIKILMQ